MNQVADENFKKIKCTQISTNMKNKSKKAKDRSEAKDELCISNPEELSETLDNTLHINNVSNNLTNGTNDHPPNDGGSEVQAVVVAQSGPPAEETRVHSVEVGEEPSLESHEATAQHTIDSIIDDALENLENTLLKREQSPQDDIDIISYESELQMPEIMRLIQKDLSEPYSIYTYRYFIHNWPKLCFLAKHEGKCIGAIVCKLDMHRNVVKRGYIAMLAVDEKYRNRKIGSRLARKAIKVSKLYDFANHPYMLIHNSFSINFIYFQAMIDDNADEVVLETEITNKPALRLYENLGFVRDKRLFRYYLNGVDALRLKLWLR